MRHVCAFSVFMLVMLLSHNSATADSPVVGSIKQMAGDVSVIRGEETLPASEGMKLLKNDAIVTGKDGSIGIIFRDNSILSLGPKSRIVIDEFMFSPAEKKFGFLIRLLKGTAAFMSGEIGRLSPGSVSFETPVATIGLRGTRFAMKIADEQGGNK